MKFILLLLVLASCSSYEYKETPQEETEQVRRLNRMGPNKW